MSKRNVVHVELPAVDVKGASRFYEELFGWKMQYAAEFDYTMWEDGGGFGGGFNKVSDEHPAGRVLVYIDSDDIEADLRRVGKLGGKVLLQKTEIPGTGWYGVFEDPTGNVLALYTSVNPTFNK
jgi:predicted enzyme related to lactoylglutathione lyase